MLNRILTALPLSFLLALMAFPASVGAHVGDHEGHPFAENVIHYLTHLNHLALLAALGMVGLAAGSVMQRRLVQVAGLGALLIGTGLMMV